ncbi:MAG: signal peptidase II [Clostridia bacterium]|nr:signal peptidase II [Clostridia bacterium]
MIEIIIAAIVLLLDQASKIICEAWLTTLPMNTYSVIKGVFSLTYVQNTGASFGMLAGQSVFFIIITSIACALMVWFLIKEHKNLHKMMRISVALMLSGAVGNLIDRVLLGYVRDMIEPTFINFAVFNIADCAVCIGVALLALDVLFLKKGREYADDLEKRLDARKKKDKSHAGE